MITLVEPAALEGFDPSIGNKSFSHAFCGLFSFWAVLVENFYVFMSTGEWSSFEVQGSGDH